MKMIFANKKGLKKRLKKNTRKKIMMSQVFLKGLMKKTKISK